MRESELVSYHVTSPNLVPGCLNTGNEEDGVVFTGIEDVYGHAFVGRTSLVEAAAVLFDLTVNEVNQRLNADGRNMSAKYATLKRRHDELLAQYAELKQGLEAAKQILNDG